MTQYDVIVIGGGPAGLAAATGLAKSKRVLVIERDLWGGTCPNRGCDPKKMLYRAAEVQTAAQRMQDSGLKTVPTVDWPQLMAYKRGYTTQVPTGTLAGLKASGIETRHGAPHFVDAHTVALGTEQFTAADIIIATGREPARPDVPGAELLQTSNEFLDLDALPKTIAFLGAGYVSLELANIAAAAGAEVHLINRSKRALRAFDIRAVATLREQMAAKRIQFHDDVQLQSVEAVSDGVRLQGAPGFDLTVAMAISAVGRVPAVALDLAAAGVATTAKGIAVDGFMQTNVPHVYAIGDVVAKAQPKLTPVASFEGRYLARHLSGMTEPIQYPVIPEIVFGATELAQVGVTLAAANAAPQRYSVLDQDVTHWYTYNRVQEAGARVVTITDRQTQRLAGALVVGAHAEELINQFTAMIANGTSTNAKELIYAYPSAASDLQYLL